MFTLTLVTPEKRLVTGQEVEEVFIPGWAGELEALPGHAPLLTILETGVLRYKLKGDAKMYFVAVSSGYAQVHPTGVNVLAETAERPEEIDVDRTKVSEQEAEARLATQTEEPESIKHLQDKVNRARTRREVASHLNS
jgi:F-type H+-transporting ATPase subunit epsilon